MNSAGQKNHSKGRKRTKSITGGPGSASSKHYDSGTVIRGGLRVHKESRERSKARLLAKQRSHAVTSLDQGMPPLNRRVVGELSRKRIL